MKRALVLCGGWPGHYPEQISDFAEEKLLNDFSVERITDLSFLSSGRLQEFDLIVPIWTQGKLDRAQESALVTAVESGVGIAAWHGIADAFNDNHMFHFVLGGQFICHPGDFVDYEVEITAPDDPITQGLKSFKLSSEQYYMHTDPANEVLATTRFSGGFFPWIEGAIVPVAWRRQWGKGRVFYHSIGHSTAELSIPEVLEMTRRGIQWAVRS